MLKLTLVTPEKKMLTDAEVEEIFVPGFKGELNILPGHAPLITTLEPGALKFRLKGDNKLKVAAIGWGYCEVYADAISVLAETAEFPEDIELENARMDLKEANAALATGSEDPEDFEKNIERARLAETRLEVFDYRDTSLMH